jgi:hypothetical protein
MSSLSSANIGALDAGLVDDKCPYQNRSAHRAMVILIQPPPNGTTSWPRPAGPNSDPEALAVKLVSTGACLFGDAGGVEAETCHVEGDAVLLGDLRHVQCLAGCPEQ